MFVLSDKDWQELGLNKAEMVIDGMDWIWLNIWQRSTFGRVRDLAGGRQGLGAGPAGYLPLGNAHHSAQGEL